MYLADTNILSEPTKRYPNPVIVDRLESRQPEIATAAPAWNELFYGLYRMPESRRKRAVEYHLFEVLARALDILPYNSQAAEWHAAERARLSRIGRTPPYVDGQIAAVAYVNGLTLVTANVSDYSNFQELRIENWAS